MSEREDRDTYYIRKVVREGFPQRDIEILQDTIGPAAPRQAALYMKTSLDMLQEDQPDTEFRVYRSRTVHEQVKIVTAKTFYVDTLDGEREVW